MSPNKTILFALMAVLAATSIATADDSTSKASSSTNGASINATNRVPKSAPGKQADVASKTAKFDVISKTNDVYKTALDAHALDAASKQAGKDGAFKGTVAKIFEPRGMAIINFDADYKMALTALLHKENFDKFPALTNLVGKEVVVTGKFIDYQGHAEIVLTNTAQIKLAE